MIKEAYTLIINNEFTVLALFDLFFSQLLTPTLEWVNYSITLIPDTSLRL